MRKTRVTKIGKILIGGANPIAIQSMTNTKTSDFEATLEQVVGLKNAGCDIVRLAVSSHEESKIFLKLKERVDVALVADIQFDHRLAILSAENGADKLRFNPSNIGSNEKIKKIADCAKAHKIPIRVGANGGSLKSDWGKGAEGLVSSALGSASVLENAGFFDIVLSVKSSDVRQTIEANRMLFAKTDYPLHLGVTESGTYENGLLKSAVGIGSLLCDQIGDTIRVSLSGDPVQEVDAARRILRAAGADSCFVDIISCPTCSRCNYNLESVAKAVSDYTKNLKIPLKIAIMGCAVNGPGEAKSADLGVAGGIDNAVLFQKGEIIRTIKQDEMVAELKKLIDICAEEKQNEQSTPD